MHKQGVPVRCALLAVGADDVWANTVCTHAALSQQLAAQPIPSTLCDVVYMRFSSPNPA